MPRKRKSFRKNTKEQTYTALRDLTREDIVIMAQTLIAERYRRYDVLQDPQATRDYLRLHLGDLEQEVFSCVFLDNRHRVIMFEKLFFGTVDGTSVHAREVVKKALFHNAAAVIFAHNHPSGVAEPSRADICLTNRLKDALSIMDIRVLDHIVIGAESTTSLAERGLL